MKTKVLLTILCSMLWVGSIKAQLKVGDAHLDGIVAVLNADGKTGLIMQKSNMPTALNSFDAKNAVAKLGTGWRYPTVQECTSMYKNNSILKIPATAYWTSSPYGTMGYVFTFSFLDGKSTINNKIYLGKGNNIQSVRAVKPF
jgi:hypothetical protein